MRSAYKTKNSILNTKMLLALWFLLVVWVALLPVGGTYAQESTSEIAPTDNSLALQDKTWVEYALIECASSGCDQAQGRSDEYRTVVFTKESRVYGASGCNQYSGVYRLDGNQIKLGPLSVTRMYCGEQSMAKEQAFLGILQNSQTYEVNGNSLTLYATNGKPHAHFKTQIEVARSLSTTYLPYITATKSGISQ